MNYSNGSMESEPLAKRKSNLADAVHGAARADKRSRSKVLRSTSTGETKGVLLRIPTELHRQLRQLALDDGTSLQALGVEALQRLLKER